MRIELESGPPIDDPTPENIDQVLRSLSIPDNSHAILERQPSCYIQAAVHDDGSFLLEHQDGSLDHHYRVPRPVSREDVIAAFQSYLRQDGQWQSRFEWEAVDVRPGAAPHPLPGSHRAPRRSTRRTQTARGRPAARSGSGGTSLGGFAIIEGVVGLIAAVLGAGALLHGVQGALASAGRIGEPGIVTVTSCTPQTRFGQSCSGTFTPADRPLPVPSGVTVEGANGRGQMMVHVRVVDGAAWPAGHTGAWVGYIVVGAPLAVVAVSALVSLAISIRRWRQAQKRPSP